MQENNQIDPQTINEVPKITDVTPTVTETSTVEVAPAVTEVTTKKNKNLQTYGLASLVVLVIAVLLVYGLERQGRISTGMFEVFNSSIDNTPVAKVNGTKITKTDFDSSVDQLLKMAAQQGADITDPAIIKQYETQAIDTLVNGELLRQAAIKEGALASAEAVESRFAEISQGVGGPEVLAERMAEFGITEKTLRRDIENEILIQVLFDKVLVESTAPVSDEDINEFYAKLGGEEAGIPPLTEVKEQVIEQIKLERQQIEVGAYIETLRGEAEIEMMLE